MSIVLLPCYKHKESAAECVIVHKKDGYKKKNIVKNNVIAKIKELTLLIGL